MTVSNPKSPIVDPQSPIVDPQSPIVNRQSSIVNSPSRPTPSGTSRLQKRRRKQSSARARTAGLIAAILLVFAGGIYLSGSALQFVRSLYSPIAVIVVIFLMIEYIVLKGRDRSRFYRIELEQARAKRRGDAEFFRRLEQETNDLVKALDELGKSSTGTENPPDAVAAASSPAASSSADLRAIRDRLDQLRRTLSRRL